MMIGNNNNYNYNYYEHQVSTQNEEGGGTNKDGGLTLKKGPWTAAEDTVLAEYVKTHGEGNWNAVQKNTGLARCGKSCRLRWANHLRPNLKKGAFSPEEENIIVELHAIMGNKWARMATRLPGRTDNEIKNYWNTRVKRRQRQGLPLYPPEIQSLYCSSQRHCQPPSTTSSFSFQNPITLKPLQSSMLTSSASHPHLHYNADPSPPQQLHFYDIPHSAATPPPGHSPSPTSTPPPVPSPSTPHSSLPSPSHVSPLQSPHHNLDFYFPRTSLTLQHHHRHKRFRSDESHENSNNNNGGSSFMLPFSSFNHNLFNPQHFSNSYSLDQSHFDPGQFISTPRFHYPLKNELPSNQYFIQNNNYSSNDDHNSNQHSSSLNVLEDMLQEAQPLTDNNEIMASQGCLVGSTSSSEGLNSGLNGKEETKGQIVNTVKHEPMAVHEWFISNGEGSFGQSSAVTDDNLGLEFELHEQIASLFPVDTAPDGHDRSLTCRSWDHNFSGIR